MRIAIDFSTLDQLGMTAGHYRYVVQLVRGLAKIAPDQRFLLFGSQPEPVPELREVFSGGSAWRYRRMVHWKHRGASLVDDLAYGAHFLTERISLFHVVHDFVPRAARCPIIVTKHDLIEEVLPGYDLKLREALYCRHRAHVEARADRIICISQTTAADLSRVWKVEPERAVVIHHGVDEKFFVDPGDDLLRDDPLYRPGQLVLVSPYNLEPRKNVSGLLAAVRLLLPDFPDLKLILFGRGLVTPERERLFEEELSREGLRDVVIRPGVISDRLLRQLYRRADLFVFPSLYEGFGLPILEALASGACVVAGAASAMAEVAGDAAALVDTSNPALLAAEMKTLLRDQPRRDQLRAAGPPRAREFPVERMVEQTWALYQEVLEQTGAERSARRDKPALA